jgi:putative DNA primase/helicase
MAQPIIQPDFEAGQSADGYVPSYIRRVLSDAQVAAPIKAQAGSHYDALVELHQAHQQGGIDLAKEVWETVTRMRPGLKQFDPETVAASYHKPDDDMIATELGKQIGEDAAYFHSQWKLYEEGCWRTQDEAEFRVFVKKELRRFRSRGVAVTQTRIKSIAAMLGDELFIKDRLIMERQKQQTNYINLRSGLFNLTTMQPEDHRRDLYFTTQMDFDYDPKAMCPTFHKYLNSSLVHPDGTTDFELKALALEAVGYCLTARTDMKVSFWLVGGKDCGKSTFITILKMLMGELYATIDLTQLDGNKFLLSGMVGKRVVAFSEGDSNATLPDGIYKNLTGGTDEVWADVKNKPGITFRPEAKIVWAMNNMPRINDRTGATIRRIIIIPFNRSIPESEQIHDLEHKLMRERAGIFNLAIDHLIELTERGSFIPSKQSDAKRTEYIMENDTEATYIEERVDLGKDYRVPSGELYRDYALWCENNGFKAKNANQIAKEWKRLGLEHKHSSGKWWIGLRLRAL